MSDILNTALEKLQAKFEGADFGSSVKFVISDEGSIVVNNNVASLSDDDADVTMTADADVFQEILEGELDGASAFMSGKLAIDGDMGLAMQLGQVLSS